MSHKDVEQIVSRAVVDEQFRELLFASPNEALADLRSDRRRAAGAPEPVTRQVQRCAGRFSSCGRPRGARPVPAPVQSGRNLIGAASGTSRATRTDLVSDAAVSTDGRRGMTARAALDAGRAGSPTPRPPQVTTTDGVVLVSMPFDSPFQPSIGLSLLKAALAPLAIPVQILSSHAAVCRADRHVDLRRDRTADIILVRDLAGDWLFAAALFDPTRLDEAAYVSDIVRRGWPSRDSAAAREAFIDRLLDVRAQVDSFAGRIGRAHCKLSAPDRGRHERVPAAGRLARAGEAPERKMSRHLCRLWGRQLRRRDGRRGRPPVPLRRRRGVG